MNVVFNAKENQRRYVLLLGSYGVLGHYSDIVFINIGIHDHSGDIKTFIATKLGIVQSKLQDFRNHL